MKHTININDFDGEIFTHAIAFSGGNENKRLFFEIIIDGEFNTCFNWVVQSKEKRIVETGFLDVAINAYNKL